MQFSTDGYFLRIGGKEISLAPREMDLWRYLAEKRAATREEIEAHLWPDRPAPAKMVEMLVSRIRAKLVSAHGEKAADVLLTERGVGYRLGVHVQPGETAPDLHAEIVAYATMHAITETEATERLLRKALDAAKIEAVLG